MAAVRLDGAGRATASVRHGPAAIHRAGEHWIAAWGASPQAPIASNLSVRGFGNQTVREIVYASTGGAMLRVRLSNAFGAQPVRVAAASVAVQVRGADVVPGTLRPLSFAGRPAVSVPARRDVASDPVVLRVHPGTHLAVSLYLSAPSGPVTQHTQARQVNWVAAGPRTLDTSGAPSSPRPSRGTCSAASTCSPRGVRAASSSPSGTRSPTAWARPWTPTPAIPTTWRDVWPPGPARRSASWTRASAATGSSPGPNAVAWAGWPASAVTCWASRACRRILLEGVNDIGQSQSRGPRTAPHTPVSALQTVEGYERIIAMARAAGVGVFGATLTPFHGARSGRRRARPSARR